MSWTLSAIVLCGTLALFAAGTQGGKIFRFPNSHRASTLDRVVEGPSNNHKVTRQDLETCTPYSDEYYRRLDTLECNEDYQRAVREDITTSDCINQLYQPDDYYGFDYDDTSQCPIIDDRVDVRVNCTEECSVKQAGYFYCKYLGEERVNIQRECGMTVVGAGECSFNNKFCVFELNNPSSDFQTVYNKCFVESNVNDGSCSDECKEALDDFKDAQGCCVTYLLEDLALNSNTDEADLLSTCGVEAPEVCKSFSPPERFRECAHIDGDVHVTPTVLLTMVLILISQFNA